MNRSTGGVVKMDQVHCIGDDHCSHCLPFPDPDYTFDVALIPDSYNVFLQILEGM